MGSSSSKPDKPQKGKAVDKNTQETKNVNDLNESVNNQNITNTDKNKKNALENANKRHAANAINGDHNSSEGPRIDLPDATYKNIEEDEKSAKEAKRDVEKQEKETEIQKREADKKRKNDEATAGARVSSLKEQLNSRMDKFRKQHKGPATLVEFETLDGLRNTLKRLQKKLRCEIMIDNVEGRNKLLEHYKEFQDEKSRLTLRVSELAAVQLKHNNPNIADLSDENRASKIAEKFSELYDNEYTDLHEVYNTKLDKNIPERTVICHIRDSLKFCYQECHNTADKQRHQLLNLLFKDNSIDPVTTAAGLQLRVKEFQKKVANITIPKVQLSVHRKIVNNENLKELIQRISPKGSSLNSKLSKFLNRCTELSWYTQIQDPPVVLDFTIRENTGDYRSYTQSGSQIDFVVWPVMLLHGKGAVLSKGTAQFKSSDKSGDMKADTIKTEKSQNKRKKDQSNAKTPKEVKINDKSKSPRAETEEPVKTADSEW